MLIMLTFYVFFPNRVDESFITKVTSSKLVKITLKNNGTKYYGNVLWIIFYLF